MKKIFCILSILTLVSPVFAAGEPEAVVTVPGDPGATTTITSSIKAANAPGYSLKSGTTETNNKTVTAGYVKGAYNATIKAVNMVADQKQNKLNSGSGGNIATSGTGALIRDITASAGSVTVYKAEVTIPIGSEPSGSVPSGRAPLWIE